MNDPTERMGKVMDEMCKTQKACLAHCRPQLYPHFVHRGFIFIYYNIFLFFLKKQKNKNFLLFHLHVYNFLQLVALII